jgi:hypothetical protein
MESNKKWEDQTIRDAACGQNAEVGLKPVRRKLGGRSSGGTSERDAFRQRVRTFFRGMPGNVGCGRGEMKSYRLRHARRMTGMAGSAAVLFVSVGMLGSQRLRLRAQQPTQRQERENDAERAGGTEHSTYYRRPGGEERLGLKWSISMV